MIQELDTVNAVVVTADSYITLKEKRYRMDILKIMIHNRLETADVFRYSVDVIDEFFELQQKEIDDLQKLKYHRHKTVFGLYTEKQVY